jgi:hypothetical protein
MTLGDGPGAGRLGCGERMGWAGRGGDGAGAGGTRGTCADARARGTLTLDEGEGHVLDGQQGATLRATQAA